MKTRKGQGSGSKRPARTATWTEAALQVTAVVIVHWAAILYHALYQPV